MRAHGAIGLLLVVGLAWPGGAAGGRPAPGRANAQIAREHYAAATRLFNARHYDDALAEFETAYELKDDPAFLYNIAQCHRFAGRPREAITFYRKFLAKTPDLDGNKRAHVVERINDLEREIDRARIANPGAATTSSASKSGTALTAPSAAPSPFAAPSPSKSPPPFASTSPTASTSPSALPSPSADRASVRSTPSPASPPAIDKPDPGADLLAARASPRAPSRTIAWVLLGSGGAIGVAGAALGLAARSAGARVESTWTPAAPVLFATVADDETRGRALTWASYACYGVGAAAVITGVVLAITRRPGAAVARLDWLAAPTEHGVVAGVAGTF